MSGGSRTDRRGTSGARKKERERGKIKSMAAYLVQVGEGRRESEKAEGDEQKYSRRFAVDERTGVMGANRRHGECKRKRDL